VKRLFIFHWPRRAAPCRRHRAAPQPLQCGVALVVVLIFLVVVSLLAATSMRNATSSESVLGNVRTTEMASQAAEIALRHCEASVLHVLIVAAGGNSTYATTFELSNILQVSSPPHWQNIANWDSAPGLPYVLPLSLVNQIGIQFAAYKRPPECMVEPVPIVLAGESVLNTTTTFVVTARGFGPEVAAADASRSHPVGSEVWLQSHIQIQ
jgi:type IV pilus assembly protein PilX